MQRKLISMQLSVFVLTRRATGTPEIKATSFWDLLARTPICHSFRQPGDLRALRGLVMYEHRT